MCAKQNNFTAFFKNTFIKISSASPCVDNNNDFDIYLAVK